MNASFLLRMQQSPEFILDSAISKYTGIFRVYLRFCYISECWNLQNLFWILQYLEMLESSEFILESAISQKAAIIAKIQLAGLHMELYTELPT